MLVNYLLTSFTRKRIEIIKIHRLIFVYIYGVVVQKSIGWNHINDFSVFHYCNSVGISFNGTHIL